MHLPNLTLEHHNGTLALRGPSLTTAALSHTPSPIPSSPSSPPPPPPPKHPLHITLLTPTEYKHLNKPPATTLQIPTRHIYSLGLAQTRHGKVKWLVISWNHGNEWRRENGLCEKQFHVTLTAEDDWGVEKGFASLLSGGVDRSVVLERVLGLGEVGVDCAVLSCEGGEMHEELIQAAICRYPDSYRGYIRLAEVKRLVQPKLSLLCYARAASLNPGPRLLKGVVKKILALRSATSYGALVTADELASIPVHLTPYVLLPFPQILHEELSPHLWTFESASRKQQLHLGGRELPRFFTWVYPHRLGGMSTPRSASDIEMLQEMGFTHVLTLTEEEPLPAEWFTFRLISNLFVPVANYHAPTLEEMDNIYQRVQGGGTWLVHCGGGKGRAGTVLACLIAMMGLNGAVSEDENMSTPQMDGRTAMATLRSMRPGSLETETQENFVTQWLSHRWQAAYKATVPIEEPWTQLQQEVNYKLLPQGVQPGAAGVLFLVGKPGSGKSWLSESLVKRRPRGSTIVISQDESGSRASCETMLGGTYPANTLLIIDRCNPEANDRKSWLSLIQTDKPMIAVYFEYSLQLCRQRVDQRLDHPTIKAGRGGPALRQMEKLMSPPTLAEGFAAVLTIASFAAGQEATLLLSGEPTITKFPRTTHLLNLGAITDDDLVEAEFGEIHNAHLTLEEKVDGANMGFSLDYDKKLLVQNRSHYISHAEHAQFKPLKAWLEHHETTLRTLLDQDPLFPERYILYGEWCVAQHSIAYNRLPAPFLAFDLFDRVTGTFLSRRMLAAALAGTGIYQVPLIEERTSLTREHLMGLMSRRSEYADGPIEGVYVRFEDARRFTTLDRGKVVRGDFLAGNKHWAKGPLVRNGILMAEQGGNLEDAGTQK